MKPPIDFVIITPLAEEREAVLLHLGNPKRLPPTDDDIRVYYPATVAVTFSDESKGKYRVVVTDLLEIGRVEAANAVGDAVHRWSPKYILLVGIAGGLAKAGVKVGDVLISDQIADYELQKFTPENTQIRWSVHRVAPPLLAAAKNLSTDAWRAWVRVTRPHPGQPERHIGPICTGDKVIANGLADKYRDVWAKLIGVEMEAGGVASAAFQAASRPGFFMVRGVSDVADPDKDAPGTDRWRTYACDVAASYAVTFLKSGPVKPVAEKPRVTSLATPMAVILVAFVLGYFVWQYKYKAGQPLVVSPAANPEIRITHPEDGGDVEFTHEQAGVMVTVQGTKRGLSSEDSILLTVTALAETPHLVERPQWVESEIASQADGVWSQKVHVGNTEYPAKADQSFSVKAYKMPHNQFNKYKERNLQTWPPDDSPQFTPSTESTFKLTTRER